MTETKKLEAWQENAREKIADIGADVIMAPDNGWELLLAYQALRSIAATLDGVGVVQNPYPALTEDERKIILHAESVEFHIRYLGCGETECTTGRVGSWNPGKLTVTDHSYVNDVDDWNDSCEVTVCGDLFSFANWKKDIFQAKFARDVFKMAINHATLI